MPTAEPVPVPEASAPPAASNSGTTGGAEAPAG
jgi:hypothetical protein